jgi:hypothetical protein
VSRQPPRGPALSRRWNDTVAGLLALRAEYARWLEALPEATRDTATGEALQAMVDLDLEEIMAIQPPRGFGPDWSDDVTIDHDIQTPPHDTLPARPFRAGPWPGTEQERSGQITSYINRTG